EGCCRSTTAAFWRPIQDGLIRLTVRYRRGSSVGHGRSCSRFPPQRDAKAMEFLSELCLRKTQSCRRYDGLPSLSPALSPCPRHLSRLSHSKLQDLIVAFDLKPAARLTSHLCHRTKPLSR